MDVLVKFIVLYRKARPTLSFFFALPVSAVILIILFSLWICTYIECAYLFSSPKASFILLFFLLNRYKSVNTTSRPILSGCESLRKDIKRWVSNAENKFLNFLPLSLSWSITYLNSPSIMKIIFSVWNLSTFQ